MTDTPVRERQIGPCQLERSHFGGAEHRRRHGGERARDAERPSRLDHGRESDLQRHSYRRRIE